MIDDLRQAGNRVASHLSKEPLDRELDAEMASHLELATEDNIQQGMSPEEARRHALIRFGGLT